MVQKSLGNELERFLDHSDRETNTKSFVWRITKLVYIEDCALTIRHVKLLRINEAILEVFDPDAR